MDATSRLESAYRAASNGTWVSQGGQIYALDADGKRLRRVCHLCDDPERIPDAQDRANLEFIQVAHRLTPLALEAFEAVDAARWALLSLADQVAALSEFNSELAEPWNEGGEAFEAARKIRRVVDGLIAMTQELEGLAPADGGLAQVRVVR